MDNQEIMKMVVMNTMHQEPVSVKQSTSILARVIVFLLSITYLPNFIFGNQDYALMGYLMILGISSCIAFLVDYLVLFILNRKF